MKMDLMLRNEAHRGMVKVVLTIIVDGRADIVLVPVVTKDLLHLLMDIVLQLLCIE